MAQSLKNKPKAGQKLHKFISLGGKPSQFNKVNKTAKLRASSK